MDDHNYQNPQFFIDAFHRYENIPRLSAKVLVGEFSVVVNRNSVIITGGCYAPVLQNVYDTQ